MKRSIFHELAMQRILTSICESADQMNKNDKSCYHAQMIGLGLKEAHYKNKE